MRKRHRFGQLSIENFPLLSRLELNDEEVRALTKQGFLRCEARGTKTIYRLRYRVGGRQHARYVSPRDAAALETELEILQRSVRSRRRLAHLARLARQLLRQRKLTLGPLLEARGYHFHGEEIRQRRKAH
jgi:hypothetical protein